MKEKVIKIFGINDAAELVHQATLVDGDITLKRGRYVVDAKSLMGIFSIDISQGVTVEYPEDATEFEQFIEKFC